MRKLIALHSRLASVIPVKGLQPKFLFAALALCLILFVKGSPALAGSVTLSWDPPTTNVNGTPLTDLAGYRIYYGTSSGNYSQNVNTGNTTTFQVSSLTDGLTYYFSVTAYDTSGNESTFSNEVSATIPPYTTPDTTDPSVSITGPTSASTYTATGDSLNISGTASDDTGVAQVAWSSDRGGGGTASGTTSWSAGGIALEEGSNVITVTARDAAGNTGTDVLTVTYNPPDTTDPLVSITGPTSASTYTATGDSLNISGTASDDTGVAQVAWSNDRGGGGTASGTTSWSAGGIALEEGSNVITVTARDAAGNTGTDVLTVTYNPPDKAPDITVTEITTVYGNVCVNSNSERTVTARNDGDADLVIQDISATSPPFTVVSNGCSSQTLSPGESCAITIEFSPEQEGSFNGSFVISSNDPDEDALTVALTGTGTYSGVCPDVAVLPGASMSFPGVLVGVTAEQSLTVKNEGNVELAIFGITLPASPFGISHDGCAGQTLPPTQTCTVTVSFAPMDKGPFKSSFDIRSDDPDEDPQSVSLWGSTNTLPNKPKLVYPGNGSKGIGTTTKFKWNKSTDPDGDAVDYDLYYCKNSNFTKCTPVEVASVDISAVSYAGIGGGYVFALLLFGAALTRGRRKMTLLAAILVLATSIVLFSCGSGGDGGSGGTPAPSAEVSRSVSGLSPGSTYYWKVIADDGKGGTAESEVRTFTTE